MGILGEKKKSWAPRAVQSYRPDQSCAPLDATTILRNALYNAAVVDATVYLGLFDGSLDADELSPTGYVREAVIYAAPTDGAGANSTAVAFDAFTGAGGDITHVALFDAASGGNRLTAIKELTGSALAWEDSVPVIFPIGTVGFAVQ
jgi:hypothetical protein